MAGIETVDVFKFRKYPRCSRFPPRCNICPTNLLYATNFKCNFARIALIYPRQCLPSIHALPARPKPHLPLEKLSSKPLKLPIGAIYCLINLYNAYQLLSESGIGQSDIAVKTNSLFISLLIKKNTKTKYKRKQIAFRTVQKGI